MESKGRILAVDDDMLILRALSELLTRDGYEVVKTKDSSEALGLAWDPTLDLVITDLHMPRVSGLDLLKAFKDAQPDVEVILMTGDATVDTAIEAMRNGAFDYVCKPFESHDELKLRIGRAIERRHLRKHAAALESALQAQHERAEQLLLNVLPRAIAERLEAGESVIADRFPVATVLFSDLVDFTALSAAMPAADVVKLLNELFSAFDQLAGSLGVEKIKTLGDGYLAVAGLPRPRDDHAVAIAELALGMQDAVRDLNRARGLNLQLRIGLHTGPVVAGVIGLRRFSYDIWGDTVNTASRMESAGVAGRIHLTQSVCALLERTHVFEPRGRIALKGKGELDTFLLRGKRDADPRPAS